MSEWPTRSIVDLSHCLLRTNYVNIVTARGQAGETITLRDLEWAGHGPSVRFSMSWFSGSSTSCWVSAPWAEGGTSPVHQPASDGAEARTPWSCQTRGSGILHCHWPHHRSRPDPDTDDSGWSVPEDGYINGLDHEIVRMFHLFPVPGLDVDKPRGLGPRLRWPLGRLRRPRARLRVLVTIGQAISLAPGGASGHWCVPGVLPVVLSVLCGLRGQHRGRRLLHALDPRLALPDLLDLALLLLPPPLLLVMVGFLGIGTELIEESYPRSLCGGGGWVTRVDRRGGESVNTGLWHRRRRWWAVNKLSHKFYRVYRVYVLLNLEWEFDQKEKILDSKVRKWGKYAATKF